MVDRPLLRIALIVHDGDRVGALLSDAPDCRFHVDTFPTASAARQALERPQHDAYVIDTAVLASESMDPPAAEGAAITAAACRLLRQASATGRPVIVLTSPDWAGQDEALLAEGAWDCLPMASLTAPLIAHSIRRGVHQARKWGEERQYLEARKMEATARLAAGVAHDFNNLLTAMLGYAEMLRESLDPADVRREDVAEIQRAGDRATALTRKLMTFGLRNPVRPQAVDLNAVVERVAAILPPILGEGVELDVTYGEHLAPARADAAQLELMIGNLASNAKDAMPTGGRLRIETAIVNGEEAWGTGRAPAGRPEVMLLVADNGTGMTPETLSHLFEPFYTTKEKGKGTGLGLAVVYGIVRQAGGRIAVDSTLGKGTTVRIYLPAVTG